MFSLLSKTLLFKCLSKCGENPFHGCNFSIIPFSLYLGQKNKYRVFGGLWFGEDKPFFSTFFKPFVDTLKETEVHGELTPYTVVIFSVTEGCAHW